MKSLLRIVLLIVLSAPLLLNSCKKDKNEDPEPIPTPPAVVVKNTYSGSGSYGDLVTFEINQTDHTYSIYNESTGQSSSGTYTIQTGQLQGVYRINIGGNSFFSVELSDKFLAANFPTGNPLNNLSFGISSEIDNTNNMANIAGDYIFFEVDADGYFNNPIWKEWGALAVYSNGIFEGISYATGGPYPSSETIAPEDFTDGFPINQDSIEFDGTFTVSGTHKERLITTLNQDPLGTYNGFVYATASQGALILDKGLGNGFILALKINTSSNLSAIAGSYKYVSVLDNNTAVGGNATISGSSGTYYQETSTGVTESGTLQNIQQCANFHNVYYGEMVSTQVDGKIYLCIVGDIFFSIAFNNSGEFVIYGAGAKL
jgi:hypothetical protein